MGEKTRTIRMAPNEDGKAKEAAKKKAKSTPKKERQISLRLSPKGAKRLSRLTEAKEWTVTQIIEEALKVYAAQEGVSGEDKAEDPKAEVNEDTLETPRRIA